MIKQIINTNTVSWTGSILYSDAHEVNANREGYSTKRVVKQSFLNNWAMVPVLGIGAGAFRVVLAIIHTLGHLAAAVIQQNLEHTSHAMKGCAELLRGLIEMVPIAGRVFSWKQYPGQFFGERIADDDQDYWVSVWLVAVTSGVVQVGEEGEGYMHPIDWIVLKNQESRPGARPPELQYMPPVPFTLRLENEVLRLIKTGLFG